jgi:uncharacterized repeat protein (TIGR01451 family)
MGRKRSLVSTWLIALCAACVLVAGLPAQLAGAGPGDPGRDPGDVIRDPGDPPGGPIIPPGGPVLPPGDPPPGGGDSGGGFGGGGTGSSSASSDLSIIKSAGEQNALTGEQILYTFTVGNAGPDASSAVTVTDALPAGLTFAESAGLDWECSAAGQTVTCTHPTPLPAGPNPNTTLAIVADVGAGAVPDGTQATVTNTATVSGPNPDPNSSNNSTSASTTVHAVSDVTVMKDNPGDFTVGFLGAWEFVVTNHGPGVAGDPVVVEDTLPAGFEFAGFQGDPNGWECGQGGEDDGFICLHDGPLGVGDSVFTILVMPLPAATPGGLGQEVTNTATVQAGNELPENQGNNTASDTAFVDPGTDLRLVKSHSGNFTHGQHGTYTLAVTNLGSFATTGVMVKDTLPEGWGYVAAGSGGNGWTCPATDDAPDPGITIEVLCTHAGSLAGGATTSFPLIADVPSGLANQSPIVQVNNATVFADLPDPNDFNSSAADNTRVVDSTPPVITVPDDITEPNDPGQATALVSFNVTATDNTPNVFFECNPPLGTAFPIGTTTVTCTATDTSLNTDMDSFDITVVDIEPPVVTAPANITVANDPGLASAVVNYPAPTVTDNAPGVTSLCSPPSGSTFPLGLTTVTCTATDAAGNTATASFTVTVVDTQPPALTVPANMTRDATSPSGAAVAFGATATDNAPGVTVACVPPSGSTFPIGTTTVMCTATDAAGNTASKSFQIKVLGAVDQIKNLINRVNGMTIKLVPKVLLKLRLNTALLALKFNAKGLACWELARFVNEVRLARLSTADTTALTGDANRIRAVLSC